MSTLMGEQGPTRPSRWLRRYVILILLVTMVGGIAGGLYAASRSQSYSSSAQVLLRPSVGNPFNPETGSSSQQITIAVATEAALVDSDEVMALASDSTGTSLGSGSVSASVPPSTSTILVTARSTTADGARTAAQAVADSFLQYRQRVSERYQEQSGSQLRTQIAAVQRSLAATGNRGAAARRSDVLTAQLVALQSSLVEIQSAATDPGTLVSLAGPGARSGIGSIIFVVGGLVVGLLAGVGAAFVLGRRDTRISAGADDVVAGVPVLTSVGPASPAHRSDDADGADGADGADRAAYQQLRTFLLASYDQPTVVAVGGVGPTDRSGDVALGLGRSIARAGYRVAVVLTSGSEAEPFGDEVGMAAGLAEAISNEVAVTDLLIVRDGVAVLAPGRAATGDDELMSGRRFEAVVEQLRVEFDHVILVAGPVSRPGELAAVRAADVLLPVATEGQTSEHEVREVARRATAAGLPVIGLALRSQSRRSKRKRAPEDAAARPEAFTPRSERPERSERQSDAAAQPDPTGRGGPDDEVESAVDDPAAEDRPSLFRW